ncbi:hypothetical protein RDI58_018311 [Solanum bulbocastanum]|uniref:RNase III domain-containing protein n=1 Tax=Solanum bulbocastanum TaxID=147425 RepID=A0AAN8YAU3_SOLBU
MEEQSFQKRERLVQEITGYKLKNPNLLHQAFTHPSVPQNWASNDRMEYLGDSILNIVEALIGAIYIDCNCSIDTTWQAVKDMLQSLITPETLEIQSVTKFIELCQKNNLRIQLVDNWDKTREIEYFVDGKFAGKGKSSLGEKKETAKNKAANNAYHQVIKNLREKTSVDEMQS